MTEETLRNLVINKVPSQEVYDAMVTAGLINSDELYLVAGESSGPYIAETTLYDNGGYDKGWATVDDADDIIATYISGRTVIIHFLEYEGYIGGEEKYATVIGCNPGSTDYYNQTEIVIASQFMNGSIVEIGRSQSDKFQFKLYID